MTDSAEVVVVGGGIQGCATAWALTARGIGDVLVIERDTVASGGTGKSSGIVRCHYGVRSLAAMAWRGTQVLENAEDVLGADAGFRRTGYVVGVGAANVAALRATVSMHVDIGIEVDLVTRDEVAAMWPSAHLDDFAAFAYEPRGGYGDGHQTANALAGAARRGGATIRQGSSVVAVEAQGDRVSGVRLTDGTTISTGTVVVAAGPWSSPLVAPLGVDIPIRVQCEHVLMLDPGQPLGDVPVFSDLVSLQYLRTSTWGELLLGNSDMSTPVWVDSADGYSNTVPTTFVEDSVERFAGRFPLLDDVALSSSYAGCYDVTPDYNPVMSASPIDGLYIAAGFSGHGYKIAPAVGELMADLVLTGDSGSPNVDAQDFRLSRFAEGTPLTSPHPYIGAGSMR